jgi:hypothetical protein
VPAPPRATDPLPLNVIRLSDAFNRYYRAITPDAAAIDSELTVAQRILTTPAATAIDAKAAKEKINGALSARENAESRAEMAFRAALATGRPMACIRDPKTGDVLQLLDYRQWTERNNFGTPGFSEDFVDPDDLIQPGPSACIDGLSRPVFFYQREFDEWLSQQSPSGPQEPMRVGAPATYDWDDIEQFVFRELDNRGDFRESNQVLDWRTQNDVIRAIEIYLNNLPCEAPVPAHSTLKPRVKDIITRWRALKSSRSPDEN